MGTHFFIDETKAKGYVLVAAACPDSSLAPARRAIGRLVLPRQRTIHMKHENPRRRGHIADAICSLGSIGVRAFVADAGRGPEPEHVRRERALRVIVGLAAAETSATLVLDLDQTLVARDSQAISRAAADIGTSRIIYSHQTLAAQPLLAIPDVVAWCWARGGTWRRRVAPVISDVIDV